MGRALDSPVLHALNDIACAVTKGTKATIHAMTCFLNYIASNPLPSIMCRASNMILYVVSDAAYLVSPKVRSRTGGFHYLGSNDGSYTIQCTSICTGNGKKKAMVSAAEAEVAALYLNAQEIQPFRQCLTDMGHPEPATQLNTDHQTATGILNGTIKQSCCSKAIDMGFY